MFVLPQRAAGGGWSTSHRLQPPKKPTPTNIRIILHYGNWGATPRLCYLQKRPNVITFMSSPKLRGRRGSLEMHSLPKMPRPGGGQTARTVDRM